LNENEQIDGILDKLLYLVVSELPAVSHIITNLSYFAHSHFFTLRENTKVAVATEIHQSLVPTQENETIIFEVLQKFKDAGKKVILYISTNYLDGALLKLKIQ